jgi:hypothetical protein
MGTNLDRVGRHVLLDTIYAPRSGNRRNIVAASEDPGERGLCRGRPDLGADRFHLIDDRQVALEVLADEPRLVPLTRRCSATRLVLGRPAKYDRLYFAFRGCGPTPSGISLWTIGL